MTCFPQYKTLFLEFLDTKTSETAPCYCLQNCLDSNVIVEKFQVLKGTKSLLGSIGGLVIMKKYPLIRFQREIIFTLTDFFGEINLLARIELQYLIECLFKVSIGGTAGFFIGCSVMSVIEIIYFFSLRLVWFVFGYRNWDYGTFKWTSGCIAFMTMMMMMMTVMTRWLAKSRFLTHLHHPFTHTYIRSQAVSRRNKKTKNWAF